MPGPPTNINHLPDDVLSVVFRYVAEDTSEATACTVYGLPRVCTRWQAVCKRLVSPVFAPELGETDDADAGGRARVRLSLLGARFRTDGALAAADNGFLAQHSRRAFLGMGIKLFTLLRKPNFGARLLSEVVDPFRSLNTLAFSGGGVWTSLTDAVLECVADRCPLLERFELSSGFRGDDAHDPRLWPAAPLTTRAVNAVLQRCRKLRKVALVACHRYLHADPAHPRGLGLAGSTVTDLTLVNELQPGAPNPHAFTGPCS